MPAEQELLPPRGGEDSGATEIVKAGYALMRAENDAMLSVSIQRPRDEKKVLQNALGELKLVPELASGAYYSIPYRDKRTGETTYVEGPSIKAATALARRWGNCSCGVRLVDHDANGVTVEGVFLDYETNVRFSAQMYVSRFQRRYGKFEKIPEDRWVMAMNAAASKAMRNAIVKGLPDAIVTKHFQEAKELVSSGIKDFKEKVPQIRKAFARFGVTEEQLSAYIGKKLDALNGQDYQNLNGLFIAIRDGEISVKEAFSTATSDEQGGDKKGGAKEPEVTVGDLKQGSQKPKSAEPESPPAEEPGSGKGKGKPEPEPEPEEEAEPEPAAKAKAKDPEPAGGDDAAEDALAFLDELGI